MKIRNAAFASAVAILASAGSVWAADSVVYEQAPEPVVVSAYDWSGVYVGVQGGYGWADVDADFSDSINDGDNILDDNYDLDGGFVGIYGGYNWQLNNLVLGVEGDINKSWIGGDDLEFVDTSDGIGDFGEIDVEWFGSLRGRLGYAFDRTLIFGTAGVAFANLNFDAADDFSDDVGDVGFEDDENYTGWTAGVGVEHAFTDNWLARAEYRYYDFGNGDFVFDDEDETGDFDLDMHTVSVGLAYKF